MKWVSFFSMFQTEIRLSAHFFFNVPLQPAQVHRLLGLVTVGRVGGQCLFVVQGQRWLKTDRQKTNQITSWS